MVGVEGMGWVDVVGKVVRDVVSEGEGVEVSVIVGVGWMRDEEVGMDFKSGDNYLLGWNVK